MRAVLFGETVAAPEIERIDEPVLNTRNVPMISTQNSSHLTIKESAAVKPAKVQKQDLSIPFTPAWIVRQLQNDSLDESLMTLQTWMTSNITRR